MKGSYDYHRVAAGTKSVSGFDMASEDVLASDRAADIETTVRLNGQLIAVILSNGRQYGVELGKAFRLPIRMF